MSLVSAALPVLPAVTDTTVYNVGLQPAASTRTNALYIAPALQFTPATGLLTTPGNLTAYGLTVNTSVVIGTTLSVTGAVYGNLSIQGNTRIYGNATVDSNLTVGGNIVATANAAANIGSLALQFNTIFAKATQAQYADLAENYASDADYAAGTVLVFGGEQEVTISTQAMDRRVAGVVSTDPAYLMNSSLTNSVSVALTGRVPCFVVGPVKKGDLMVAAGLGRARAETDPKIGAEIGKALEDFDGAEGTIEVVVGRF